MTDTNSTILDISLTPLVDYLLQLPDNDPNYHSELTEIMTKYESDKGCGLSQQYVLTDIKVPNGVCHNYTFFYEKLFESSRSEKINIFEMGVGVPSCMASWAGSLKGWEEYFPNSRIYSADYDKEYLYQSERITSFYVDQEDCSSIQQLWDQMKDVSFDIIIDDGPHTYTSNYLFYINSIHKLLKNGIFIIEDVNIEFLDILCIHIKEFNSKNNVDVEIVPLKIPYPSKFTHPHSHILKMNNLIFMKKH